MNKYLAESLNFLKKLEGVKVEYLIVGGVAVNIHGFQRSTGDLDIWFNPKVYAYFVLALFHYVETQPENSLQPR